MNLLERCALCGSPWGVVTFPGGLSRQMPCPCEPTGKRHRYLYEYEDQLDRRELLVELADELERAQKGGEK